MNRDEAILKMSKSSNPAGEKLRALSQDELSLVSGGGDVQPETTTLCAFTGGVSFTVAMSKLFKCGPNK